MEITIQVKSLLLICCYVHHYLLYGSIILLSWDVQFNTLIHRRRSIFFYAKSISEHDSKFMNHDLIVIFYMISILRLILPALFSTIRFAFIVICVQFCEQLNTFCITNFTFVSHLKFILCVWKHFTEQYIKKLFIQLQIL